MSVCLSFSLSVRLSAYLDPYVRGSRVTNVLLFLFVWLRSFARQTFRKKRKKNKQTPKLTHFIYLCERKGFSGDRTSFLHFNKYIFIFSEFGLYSWEIYPISFRPMIGLIDVTEPVLVTSDNKSHMRVLHMWNKVKAGMEFIFSGTTCVIWGSVLCYCGNNLQNSREQCQNRWR